jgi:hypothetical protein
MQPRRNVAEDLTSADYSLTTFTPGSFQPINKKF